MNNELQIAVTECDEPTAVDLAPLPPLDNFQLLYHEVVYHQESGQYVSLASYVWDYRIIVISHLCKTLYPPRLHTVATYQPTDSALQITARGRDAVAELRFHVSDIVARNITIRKG